MKCPGCEFENREGVKFCEKCGVKLEFICPNCEATIPLDRLFCGECGHDLRQPKEAPSIDYSEPQSYTPKYLADKILTSRSAIEGERKLVTVFFADVADFTSTSEKLDPEEVHQIMDGCFKILMDEIHKYEGTINQFTGDGVMAIFGAPVAHEDHAQRACYAALSIQKAMGEYGAKIKKGTGIDFEMRIGLNSGPVLVGSIGDDLRMDYTAVGDTTNLASRMEGATTPGSVLVSQNTHRLAEDFFEFETPDKIEVKGKDQLQEAYKLVRIGEIDTRFRASIAKGLTPFVGRKNTLPALMEVYEKAKSGSGQVVGIVGEAGVGKSRLLLEFRNLIMQDDFTYLEGRCIHYGGSMAYLPILDIFKSYFGIKDEEREDIIKQRISDKILNLDGESPNLFPPFQDLLSLKVDDEDYVRLEPKQKREKTFEAIRDLLIRMSHDRPLVLAIEDLHWIDKTTEEFIDYFIGWIGSIPILLTLLYRPEYTHQWGSKSYYNRIGLNQLTTKSSTELVQAILEEGEVVPELKELILRRTAGNPLFMEELTHTLLENGSIEKRGQQYTLSGKAFDTQVPDTVQGIIAARMDRLEDNLKRTIQVASVIGRDFAFRVLQTITGMREELKSYLLNLQILEFIYEKSLFPDLEYIFKHALTQEVAYNSLLIKKRKEIHENIGEAIELLYPERLEEFYEMLAHHYARGENPEKAYHYLKLSGDKAVSSYSNWEAFRCYEEASEVLSQMPQTEQSKRKGVEIRLLMDWPIRCLGYPEGSLKILKEGEELSSEINDTGSLAKFYSRLGFYYLLRGDPLQGIKYAEKCFGEAENMQDVELMAQTGFDLCSSYAVAGEYWKIAQVAPKAIDLLEKTKREAELFGGPLSLNLYSALFTYWGFAEATLGNFKQGEVLCEKGLRSAIDIKNKYSMAWAEFLYGAFFILKGDGNNAVSHSQESITHIQDIGLVVLLGPAWVFLGWAYYFLRELDTAREIIEKGLSIQRELGLSIMMSQHNFFLGTVHLELGDLAKARSCGEEALLHAKNANEKYREGESLILLGRVLGRTDKLRLLEAEKNILQGIGILDELRLKAYSCRGHVFLGEHYADTDQREKAMGTLRKAEAMSQEMEMDYWLHRTREVLERLKS
jgi:class 3 adenylate cyclase/tetratricopeptide (TPR) repeat protein